MEDESHQTLSILGLEAVLELQTDNLCLHKAHISSILFFVQLFPSLELVAVFCKAPPER